MKRILCAALIAACLLTACGGKRETPYSYVDYSFFDTVTTILGYGESPKEFEMQVQKICGELQYYHQLFDIYHEYEGLNNLKTINDQAGIRPVSVDQPVLDLLQDCADYWIISDRKVNAAMGSVLSLWHEARELALKNPGQAEIPSTDDRVRAAKHCDFSNVVLDLEKKTVFLKDPEMRLDVGAVAKGWAAQQVSQSAPGGMLISIGGNVCATGPKPDGSPWTVGIQNPDGEGYLRTVRLTKGSIVTSGDYQRFFEVEGKRYHHIIDPASTRPGEYWQSVTVYCQDSGLSDALSTALFLHTRENGQKLLDAVGAEAMWVDPEGTVFLSPGFPE